MKKIFTIIIVSSLFSVCYGQNKKFEAENNPCKDTFTVDPNAPLDHVCHNYVKNNSGGILKLLWRRYDVMVPTGWEPTVCDNVNCYATFVTACPEEYVTEILKGQKMLADVHVYDGGIPGPGAHVILKVYERDDTTSYINIDYLFNKESVGTNNQNRQISLRMYPNPAQDVLHVDFNSGISRIELYNVLGHKVSSFRAENSKNYDISNLEEGIYMVKFITTENKVLKTLKLIKRYVRS